MTDQVSSTPSSENYIALAADIVSAYVTKNAVPQAELPALIGSVHAALRGAANPIEVNAAEKPTPAVPIEKSVSPEFIISLEDGKRYKSLKRHLRGRGLTPEQYRAKWGLPKDYPMVAPSYAAKRSELAKSHGLGQVRRNAAKSAATVEKVTAAPKKRGRKKVA